MITMCVNGMGGMTSWMVVWGLFGLAVVALAALGGVWLARRTFGAAPEAASPESPKEILRRRYAAGDLDEDEYLRRRAGLLE